MGPRDWQLPTSAYERPYTRRRPRSLLLDDAPPAGRSPIFLAVLSLIFGVFALICGVAPSYPASGLRWVLTTVGVSAVFTGINAVRRRRGRASLLVTALSTIGIGAGVLGTLVMVLNFVATTAVDAGHSSPQAISHATAPNLAQGDQNVPLPPVPTPAPAAASIGLMEQTVGTLAFVMKSDHQEGTRWPAALQVSGDGVVTAPGMQDVVVRLPVGTRLGYRTSSDGSAYAVRLSSTSDASRYVDYDTNSGVVTPGPSGGTGS
jgi:hypothetical protein